MDRDFTGTNEKSLLNRRFQRFVTVCARPREGKRNKDSDSSPTLVYLGAASFWAYSLAKPEPVRSNVLDSPRRLIFQRWNEALLTHSVRGEMAFAAGGADSFLPGVEQTVERVLARKIVQ